MGILPHGILISLFLITTFSGWSQLHARFEHYDSDDGLSSSELSDVTQDDYGFHWIATENGLNRYDGFEFRHYQSDSTPNSIIHNKVNRILWGSDSILYVGTEGGLCSFDPATEEFTHLRNYVGDQERLRVEFLVEDKWNRLWIGYDQTTPSHGGLAMYDRATGEFRNFLVESGLGVRFIYPDELDSNTIWLGAFRNVIRLDIDAETEELLACPNCQTEGYSYDWVQRVNDSTLLVMHYQKGLFEYNPGSGNWNRINPKGAVRHWRRKGPNEWWTSPDTRGLGVYDYLTNQHSFYPVEYHSDYGIPNGRIRRPYEDAQGSVWIPRINGLSVIRADLQKIRVTQLDFPDEHRHFHMDASMINQEGTEIMAGSDYKHGLFFIDHESGELTERMTHWNHDQKEHVKISGSDMEYWGNDTIIIGTRTCIYGIEQSTRKTWTILDREQDTLKPYFTGDISIWNKKLMAVSGREGCFILYDFEDQSSRIVQYADSIDLKATRICPPHFTEDGQIWIPARNSPGIYNPHDDSFTKLSDIMGFEVVGTFDYVHNIKPLSDSILFVSTHERGILELNMNQKTVTHVLTEYGSDDYYAYSVLFDDQGRMWGCSTTGLICFDPDSRQTKWFKKVDGIPDSRFHRAHIEFAPNGEMVFGYYNIVGWFDPKELAVSTETPRVFLTEFESIGLTEEGISSPLFLEKVELEPSLGDFNFAFTSTGVSIPRSMEFRFMLDGHDREWRTSPNNKASYDNLKGGNYNLILQAKHRLSTTWATKLLNIHVGTPLIQQIWFIALLAIGLILSIWLIIRYQTRKIRREERLQSSYERKVLETEMTALRAQMNPHFLFNSLNSIKYFIINQQGHEAADYLTRFARLIRLILNNSKSNMVKLDAELEALELYIQMEQLRVTGSFEYRIHISPDLNPEFVEIPPLLLQPFAENAIWHGLSRKKGARKLHIFVNLKDEYLECVIEDNGVGRQFAREKSKRASRAHKSLGLAITEDRISAINTVFDTDAQMSIVDLVSSDGEALGTKVIVKIPA